jgi:hypothetical protein
VQLDVLGEARAELGEELVEPLQGRRVELEVRRGEEPHRVLDSAILPAVDLLS